MSDKTDLVEPLILCAVGVSAAVRADRQARENYHHKLGTGQQLQPNSAMKCPFGLWQRLSFHNYAAIRAPNIRMQMHAEQLGRSLGLDVVKRDETKGHSLASRSDL